MLHFWSAAFLEHMIHTPNWQLTQQLSVLPDAVIDSQSRSMLTTNLLERRQQLDADKAELIAPDVLEQEGVVLQVLIRQVVLNLSYELLGQFRVWGLPALLLQLSTTRASTTEEDRKWGLGLNTMRKHSETIQCWDFCTQTIKKVTPFPSDSMVTAKLSWAHDLTRSLLPCAATGECDLKTQIFLPLAYNKKKSAHDYTSYLLDASE